MTRRQDASQYVKSGLSPSKTAAVMNISGATVRQYLLMQIAEEELRRSQVVRSIDSDTRSAYDAFLEAHQSEDYWSVANAGRANGFDQDEFRLYIECRDSLNGELYNCVSKMEVFLHSEIRQVLITEFGPDEQGWWRNGIPEQIRIACVSTREADPYLPGEPYSYTTFIHLSKVIDKNWPIFCGIVPKRYASDRKELMRTFERLNGIRNAVMHPVKHFPFSDDDFDFVLAIAEELGNPSHWRRANSDPESTKGRTEGDAGRTEGDANSF